jgi:hypothetical protein
MGKKDTFPLLTLTLNKFINTAPVHLSYKPTSSRENNKQTPSKMMYVNLLLINLNTVPEYELKIKYPKRVVLSTKYFKTSSLTYDFFLFSV